MSNQIEQKIIYPAFLEIYGVTYKFNNHNEYIELKEKKEKQRQEEIKTYTRLIGSTVKMLG